MGRGKKQRTVIRVTIQKTQVFPLFFISLSNPPFFDENEYENARKKKKRSLYVCFLLLFFFFRHHLPLFEKRVIRPAGAHHDGRVSVITRADACLFFCCVGVARDRARRMEELFKANILAASSCGLQISLLFFSFEPLFFFFLCFSKFLFFFNQEARLKLWLPSTH